MGLAAGLSGGPKIFGEEPPEEDPDAPVAHDGPAWRLSRAVSRFAELSGVVVYDSRTAASAAGLDVPGETARRGGRLLPRGMPGSRF